MHPPQCSCVFCITIPSLCPPAPLLAPPPRTQSNLHMRVSRRCSTPWRRSALPPTSSLARTLYWPHCLRHTLNVSNAYPLPAPSSHWGFHVADAARRGVTLCSALPPPTSSLAYFYPVYTATAPSLPRPPALNIHMGVPRSRCSTPSCPLLTLGIPHSRRSTPRCPHVFCATTHASPCLLSAPHLFCLPSWGRRHWAAALKSGQGPTGFRHSRVFAVGISPLRRREG